MTRLLGGFTPLKWSLFLFSLLSFAVLALVVADMNDQEKAIIGNSEVYAPTETKPGNQTRGTAALRKDWLISSEMKSLDWQGGKLYRYITEKDYLTLAHQFPAFKRDYLQWKNTKVTAAEIAALNQGDLTFGGLSAYDMEVLIPYLSKQCNLFVRFDPQDIVEYYLSIRAPKPIELLDSPEKRMLNGKLEWFPVLIENKFSQIVDSWFSEYAYQIDDSYSNDLLFTLLNIYQLNQNSHEVELVEKVLDWRAGHGQWNSYSMRTKLMKHYLATDRFEKAKVMYRGDYTSDSFYRFFSRTEGELLVHFEKSYNLTHHARKMLEALKVDVPGIDRDGIDGMVEELTRLNRFEDALKVLNYIKYDYKNSEALYVSLLEEMLRVDSPDLQSAADSVKWYCKAFGCASRLDVMLMMAEVDLKQGRSQDAVNTLLRVKDKLIDAYGTQWSQNEEYSQSQNKELFKYFELIDQIQSYEQVMIAFDQMGRNTAVLAHLASMHRFDSDSSRYQLYLDAYFDKRSWGLPEEQFLADIIPGLTFDAMTYYGMTDQLTTYMCYQQGTRM